MQVELSDEAFEQFAVLPSHIQRRIRMVFKRLEGWPQVSGVKWLTGDWKHHARIRTGDYRVVFHLEGSTIVVDRLAHRKDAYAE